MSRIYKNAIELIGNTPLVELNQIEKWKNINAKILAKVEFFNPAGSVKDRIGKAMIEDAEQKELINKDTVIIEPTSGNTGVGLALVCAIKGYKLILTMPDGMSIERIKILKAYGADVVLTPTLEGMNGAIKKAEELAKKYENSFLPQQFKNRANPEVHALTTAEEIWQDTDGKVDVFISGVGSGGTISGVAKVLKKRNPEVKIIAVEPFDSPVLSGGKPGPHKLQGIGAGFVPDTMDLTLVDEIITVKTDEAYELTRELGKKEGLLVGITAGAAVYAAIEVAKRKEFKGKNIVVVLPDTGQRYFSMSVFE